MKVAKGIYSLIQYRPDESRLEAINIGVVLFSEELGVLKARFADTARTRMRKVFGNRDWLFVENEVSAIRYRLGQEREFQSADDFVHFTETRANAIALTAPRFVKVHDPAAVLDALFDRLVGETRQIHRAPRVTRKLTRAFKERGLLPYVRQNVEISIPKLYKTLKASYGYQNGRYNLIQPEQFELADEDQVFQKASRLAVDGKFIYDEPDPKLGRMKLVVVGQFRPDQKEARSLVDEIFRKNEVGIYGFDALDPLVLDIQQNADKNSSDGPLRFDRA